MRTGIIADIHENVEMLQEALKLAVFHKCDELVCLGDIVGFDHRFYRYNIKRSAKRCIDLIRSSCRWIVPGNHDLFAAGRFPKYSNGFKYPDNWFSMSSEEKKKVSRGKVWCHEGDAKNDLGEEEIDFLNSLPEYITTSLQGIKCLFSHYIFPDLTGSTTQYIERNYQLQKLWEFMDTNNATYSFSGHSHTNFTGFAYRAKKNGARSYIKAIHNIPSDSYNLGYEKVMILLPPLSGDKGKTGFAVIDSDSMQLNIISTYIT